MNSSLIGAMSLIEQAARRVTLARDMRREPVRWIADNEAAAVLAPAIEPGEPSTLHGVPLEMGQPRSEYGLDLVSVVRES